MAQGENTQKSSGSASGSGSGGASGSGDHNGGRGGESGGGARSSKKVKEKKIPQRGLGVAQLEKLRLEEEQKNNVASFQAQMLNNPFNSHPPSNGVQLQNLNPYFRQGQSMENVHDLQYNHVPYWSSNYTLGGDNSRMVSQSSFNPPNLQHPYESSASNLSLPSWMQRSMQFQQQNSSSIVNVSSGISSASSPSLVFNQMEPPSNQSYRGNNYALSWSEEEKQMVGLKRPSPFAEVPPTPHPFLRKFPYSLRAPNARSDESASGSAGSQPNLDPNRQLIRESPPSFQKVLNGHCSGDFLTLAPPAASNTPLPVAASGPSSQESGDLRRPETSGSNEQPFFSFLPPRVPGPQVPEPEEDDKEEEEHEVEVDLNLKL